jgi:hypothetical protein
MTSQDDSRDALTHVQVADAHLESAVEHLRHGEDGVAYNHVTDAVNAIQELEDALSVNDGDDAIEEAKFNLSVAMRALGNGDTVNVESEIQMAHAKLGGEKSELYPGDDQ